VSGVRFRRIIERNFSDSITKKLSQQYQLDILPTNNMTIVKLKLAGDSSPVWYILELQGKLEFSGTLNLDGEAFGDIIPKSGAGRGSISSGGSNSAVTLHIGASKVNGVIEKLPKPVIVVTKDDEGGGGEGEGDTNEMDEICEGRQKVVAIVRSKIVFRERPQPIIGGLKAAAVATAAAAASAAASATSRASNLMMQE
jgi:hypothetical protein